ncbi:MAG TPA: EAL domain-containing protein, partial [Variovorax sp.]|nr:EAL domain-containing protein [Variovorax sp.]
GGAHALNLSVVAEGVETAAQRDVLTAMHCDELQGYFYARPMTAELLGRWSRGIDRPHGIRFGNPAPSVIPGSA